MKKAVMIGLMCLGLTACDGIPRSGTIRHMSLVEARKLIDKAPQDLVILDVRTPKEFDDGHLVGAKNENIYLGAFDKNLAQYDKNKTYLVYCQTGGRGKQALKKMRELGFKNVYHLYGGYEAWVAKGLPVAGGKQVGF